MLSDWKLEPPRANIRLYNANNTLLQRQFIPDRYTSFIEQLKCTLRVRRDIELHSGEKIQAENPALFFGAKKRGVWIPNSTVQLEFAYNTLDALND